MFQKVSDGVLGQEAEHVREGKAVLFGKRNVDAIVGGGGLQFEVEAPAEALAQGQSPGAIDARAEGRMSMAVTHLSSARPSGMTMLPLPSTPL